MTPPAGTARPVLVTGAGGLLGHWMLATRPPHTNLVALAHRRPVEGVPGVHADLRDASATTAAVRRADPSLILHLAYAKDRASIVDATRHLVDAAHEVAADIVVISTDAVLPGDGILRDESAAPDPRWDYGRWKATAERIAASGSPSATIVRLPLLVSIAPDDHVVRAIRTAAASGGTTRWFTDESRRPALANEVAAAIWRIVQLDRARRRGTWHLAGAERLTRHDIARRVARVLELGDDAVEPATIPAGDDRPRDIAFTDARARDEIAWRPSPVLR